MSQGVTIANVQKVICLYLGEVCIESKSRGLEVVIVILNCRRVCGYEKGCLLYDIQQVAVFYANVRESIENDLLLFYGSRLGSAV